MSKKEAKIVTYVPNGLTPQDLERLRALAALPDDTIDLSDIPELTEKFWRNAVRARHYRPIKRQLTLRLDADILDWFKRHADAGESKGRGYQTEINKALREYVAAQQKKAG